MKIVVSTDSHDRWSTPPQIRRLWAGVLVAPIAWATQLMIGYALASTACAAGGRTVLVVLTALAFAGALGGGAIAWRMRRELPDEPEEASDSAARGHFMAIAGLILSLIFAAAIAAQAIPLAMLRPCE